MIVVQKNDNRMTPLVQSRWLAFGAIVLWATLATLGVRLSHLPPFWLTGVALLVGSLVSLPLARFNLSLWRVPLRTLALGIYGLFGFHFLLFIALRHAPPVQANLVNYLWPLGMVLLAPVFLPSAFFSVRQLLAALVGFAGAALAILSHPAQASGEATGLAWGYLPALGSALVWCTYSLMTQRVAPFATSAIGVFALTSGVLSLICHVLMEPAVQVRPQDWVWLLLMGLGPLGAAFFLWDAALKRGDARQIGLMSFLTPLLSTLLLLWDSGQTLGLPVGLAAVLIVSAAWLGRTR